MSFLNMPLAVFAVFLLICTSSSAEETVEEVWKARLRDVDNLELVENVTAIRNLNDVLSREGKNSLSLSSYFIDSRQDEL